MRKGRSILMWISWMSLLLFNCSLPIHQDIKQPIEAIQPKVEAQVKPQLIEPIVTTLAAVSSSGSLVVDHNLDVYLKGEWSYGYMFKVTKNGEVTRPLGIGSCCLNVITCCQYVGETLISRPLIDYASEDMVIDHNSEYLYITDNLYEKISKINIKQWKETKIVNYNSSDDGIINAELKQPIGLTLDSQDNLWVADTENYRIRQISKDGKISTIAGTGKQGFKDGDALNAQFNYPTDIVLDKKGGLYILDNSSWTLSPSTGQPIYHDKFRIRYLSPQGQVSTLIERTASLGRMALDEEGNLFVSEPDNHQILKIDPQSTVTVFAGSGNKGKKDGKALEAEFYQPAGLTFDKEGNLYVIDSGNNLLRKILMPSEP